MLSLILLALLAQTRLAPDQIAAHTPQKAGTRPNFAQAVKLVESGQYQPGMVVQWVTLRGVAPQPGCPAYRLCEPVVYTGEERRVALIIGVGGYR